MASLQENPAPPIKEEITNEAHPLPSQMREQEKEDATKNMWELILDKATRTQKKMIASLTSLGVFCIVYMVFVIYLGVYAYANPDPARCYYVDGLDTTGLSKETVETMAKDQNITVREGYPLDMAHLFRAWFTWGFWGSVVQILIIAIFVPLFCLYKNSYKVSQRVFLVMQGLSCCSTFMWFIIGFFWRFSKGGRVAAGDKLDRVAGMSDEEFESKRTNASNADGYQLKSGKFMSAYLWIIISAVLISVAVGSLLSVVMCLNGDDNVKFMPLPSEEDIEVQQNGAGKEADNKAILIKEDVKPQTDEKSEDKQA